MSTHNEEIIRRIPLPSKPLAQNWSPARSPALQVWSPAPKVWSTAFPCLENGVASLLSSSWGAALEGADWSRGLGPKKNMGVGCAYKCGNQPCKCIAQPCKCVTQPYECGAQSYKCGRRSTIACRSGFALLPTCIDSNRLA